MSPKLVHYDTFMLEFSKSIRQMCDKALISSHWQATRSAAGNAMIPFLS
jgi:hypothetical protein